MKMTNQDMIDEMMDEFNFSRVAKAMKCLDWKWLMGKGDPRVPSEPEIRREARRLLKIACEEESSVESGGFVAESKKTDGAMSISLYFKLDGWEVDEDMEDE